MKKHIFLSRLIVLWVGVGLSLIGCQNNDVGTTSTQMESTEIETKSEIVEATEIEIEDTEDTKELFYGCTVKDINLDFLVADMEGYTIWANQVTLIEDRIYFTVLLYCEVEENPSLFRLVSCDLDGSNIQAVPLETPEIEKKGYNLYRMTVGQDGNVYALKLENDNGYKPHYGIGIPGFTEEYSLISWDSKGQIVFESQIKPIDGKYQHVAIENIYVSKEGKITMSGTCQEFTMGLIMQVGKDGSMLDIVWTEPLISLMRDYRVYNDDGTVCTKQIEEDRWYYLIYNVNNQTLEKIEMPNEIQEYGICDGANHKIVYCTKDGYLYRYETGTDDIEQRMKVKGLAWLFEVLEIDENIFIMHYGDGQSYKVGIFTKD